MLKKVLYFLKARTRKFLFDEIWLEDYIKMGMKIGSNCSIQPGVIFDYSHCWLITIGNNVTIAPEAYILAHDTSTKKYVEYTRVGNVTIQDNVFIGARAIIMPNVTIGEGSVVAAGSLVAKSVPPYSLVAGNPAKIISTTDAYAEKLRSKLHQSPTFERDYTMKSKLDKTYGFVR